MTLRSRIWWVAALVFSAVNLFGAIFAAVQKEQFHTDIHVGLLLVGAYFVWRLAPRRIARD